MAEVGRPPALDDTSRREIAAVLSTGCSVRVAANFVGCSRTTIYRELANNPVFYDQVRHLQVANLLGPLKTIQEAARTNWRAAAWLTERLNPQDFGRRHPEMVDPEDAQLAAHVAMREIKEVIDDPKTLRKLSRRIQRIMIEGVHLKRNEKYRPRGPKPAVAQKANSKPTSSPSLPAPADEEELKDFNDEALDEWEAQERIGLNAEVAQSDKLEREELEEAERERAAKDSPPEDLKR
jgi:hypothetical protein